MCRGKIDIFVWRYFQVYSVDYTTYFQLSLHILYILQYAKTRQIWYIHSLNTLFYEPPICFKLGREFWIGLLQTPLGLSWVWASVSAVNINVWYDIFNIFNVFLNAGSCVPNYSASHLKRLWFEFCKVFLWLWTTTHRIIRSVEMKLHSMERNPGVWCISDYSFYKLWGYLCPRFISATKNIHKYLVCSHSHKTEADTASWVLQHFDGGNPGKMTSWKTKNMGGYQAGHQWDR
jgi:hypothetical protein